MLCLWRAVAIALASTLVQAGPAVIERDLSGLSTSTQTSFTTYYRCSTSLGSLSASEPVPTTTVTLSTGSSSTVVGYTVLTSIVYVTPTSLPTPFTSTVTRTATSTATAVNTVDTFVPTTITVATASTTVTVCANNISSISIVISYAAPSESPVAVVCTEDITTLFTLWPYSDLGTSTVLTSSVSAATTTTVTRIVTSTTWLQGTTSTVTSLEHYYTATYSVATTNASSCAPTTTVTRAAKCAPTNLITKIGDDVIGSVAYTYPGTGYVFFPGAMTDPGLCCQYCVENAGCAAMWAEPVTGNCVLTFTSDSGPLTSPAQDVGVPSETCGLAFVYYPGGTTSIYDGGDTDIWVQTGCGSIEPES